jgi:hypothetical protein
MARVVLQAVVSVDGYIAYPDDTVGPLFDWYGNGDTEVSARASGWTFHVSRGRLSTMSSRSGTPSRPR